MNLANLLTCSRAVLAVFVAYFLFSPLPFGRFVALFLFIVASLTDYWDGVVAREMGEVSQLGQLLDPIADKALTLAAFLSFWKLGLLPFWMVACVLVRDLLVTGARLFLTRDARAQSPRHSGKQKTAIQLLFIIAVLLYLIARELPTWQEPWNDTAVFLIHIGMWVIVVMTLFSGVRVLIKNVVKGSAPQTRRGT